VDAMKSFGKSLEIAEKDCDMRLANARAESVISWIDF
jgi:hypothetical protein